ncbi:MAG: Crp/Fnr family transcriptional regulator [Xanthobacteraceae bacterium]|nr:Crp/Fnr family transcriptional regulator [Xanthobacteraceae bacterium]
MQGEDLLPLLRKLQSIGDPTDAERKAFVELRPTIRVLDAQEDIVREGQQPSIVCLILEGFACRYATVPSGRRQILSLHIPGDIPDLQSLFIKVMDHNLATLVPTKVALIPHAAMRNLIDRNHRVAHLLWRDSLVDAAIFRKWIVGIGRRSAYARFAHLVCEFAMRMHAVGLMEKDVCAMPFTQADIADALGLSSVHVSRVLSRLRKEGLFTWSDGVLTIRNWPRLQKAAEFDPSYLQLDSVVGSDGLGSR